MGGEGGGGIYLLPRSKAEPHGRHAGRRARTVAPDRRSRPWQSMEARRPRPVAQSLAHPPQTPFIPPAALPPKEKQAGKSLFPFPSTIPRPHLIRPLRRAGVLSRVSAIARGRTRVRRRRRHFPRPLSPPRGGVRAERPPPAASNPPSRGATKYPGWRCAARTRMIRRSTDRAPRGEGRRYEG